MGKSDQDNKDLVEGLKSSKNTKNKFKNLAKKYQQQNKDKALLIERFSQNMVREYLKPLRWGK